jgi:oxygen-independent coproporphyrinogen-3 oxidase
MSEPFGIYVHWPYCQAKCPYCDFNSHVRTELEEDRWARAIAREIVAVAELRNGARPQVESIFFGGGTPSLMSGRAVGTVLEAIGRLWPLAHDIEITLEANPSSAEQNRFRDYRAAGVNRLSVGVQSLDDAALKSLGRLHNAREARHAVGLASAIFPRASFDLIYARPQHTPNAWAAELNAALEFGTEHMSLYQLTIEPATPYAQLAREGRLKVPDDDVAATLYEVTQEICEARGFPAYEISNHARVGAESRHNLIYWRYGDYAGVGPGAHGRLTLNNERIATQAERLPERWLAQVEEKGAGFTFENIAPPDAAREHLLMALRLAEGIDLAAYAARWNQAPASERIAALAQDGLVTLDNGRLKASPRGRLVLNTLIAELTN